MTEKKIAQNRRKGYNWTEGRESVERKLTDWAWMNKTLIK